MAGEIMYDYHDLDSRLARNLRDMGVTMGFLGRDTMRVMLNTIIKFTPPKTMGQGRKRVAKDIAKVIVPMDQRFKDQWAIGIEAGVVGADAIAQAFKTKSGAVYGVDKNLYRPSATEQDMASHHQRYRRKDGRVTEARAGSESGRNTLNIGRWKFVNKMHVGRAAFRRYVKSVQKKVGKGKSGWATGLTYFAAKTGGAARIPGYVKKHGLSNGRFRDALTKDGGGFASATNLLPYATAISRGTIAAARARTTAYLTKATKKQAQKIADRFNQQRASAGRQLILDGIG
jgi:hypothetical protein